MMAGVVDTLLDFNESSPSTQQSTQASSYTLTNCDPFGAMESYGHFETGSLSPGREGEPDLLFDNFDPFAPSSTTVSTKSDLISNQSMAATSSDHVVGHNFDDQFSELLGDFSPNNGVVRASQGNVNGIDIGGEYEDHDRDGEEHEVAEEGRRFDLEDRNDEDDDGDENVQDTANDVEEVAAYGDDNEDNVHGWQYSHDYHSGTQYEEEVHNEEEHNFSSDHAWTHSDHSDVNVECRKNTGVVVVKEFCPEQPAVLQHMAPAVAKSNQQPLHRRLVHERPITDDTMCRQCGKRVYEMEKLTADEIVYHKSCFRCAHCNRVLSLLNYSALDGQMLCKPHFLEIFKMRGKYETDVVPVKPDISYNVDDDDRPKNGARSSSPWRDRSFGSEDDYDGARHQPQDVMDEIPTVPLKHVRNIFENLAHTSSTIATTQQPSTAQPKKASKWDKPSVTDRPATVDLDRVDGRQQQLRGGVDAAVERRRSSTHDEDDVNHREIIQCSSTVYVLEDELPPPAFTRSILAKFRQLEAEAVSADGTKKAAVVPSFRSLGSLSSGGGSASGPARRSDCAGNSAEDSNTQKSQGQHSRDDSVERHRIEGNGDERARCRRDDFNDGRTINNSDDQGSSPAAADELPQQGLARSLLARWRSIEQQAVVSRGREEAPRRSDMAAAARRSQSTSRMEVRQRTNYDSHENVAPTRVAEYLDVHQKSADYDSSDDDQHLPHLMTKQMLAKFRTMEAENKIVARQQIPLQRQRSFKWEVKEAVPLSRGNLVVHGDIPRRSVVDAERISSPEFHADETSDYTSPVHDDELPAPSTTRNLLSMFKSLEDPSKAPPTPESSERHFSAVARSNSHGGSGRNRVSSTGPRLSTTDDEADYYDRRSNGIADEYGPDAGEYENEPVRNESVIRESDHVDEAELPERGTTRGLLAKFQQLQQQTKN